MLPISGSLSFPFREYACSSTTVPRVLVDRNWGAKFSKSGSEVFMKVYSPSASHFSSSSHSISPPCFVRSSVFLLFFFCLFTDRFSSHRFPLALAPSCCLTFVLSLSLSLTLSSSTTLLSGHPPPHLLVSPKNRRERVNPKSPSAELEQKPCELHLFLSYVLTLSLQPKLIALSIAPNLYPISRLAVAVAR